MVGSVWAPEVQAVLDRASRPGTRRVRVGNRTVRITTPCPSPEDWRDRWIYFLLVDRFNNPPASPRAAPWDGVHDLFQGGTLEGVRQQLAYLDELGAGAIWLSPVLKNCQYLVGTYHGYGIQDFLRVEPRFASQPERAEEELRALVDEAHARGMHVILDVVLNPLGPGHRVLYSNKDPSAVTPPGPVVEKPEGVEIREVAGGISRGPARALAVRLGPMEVQILGRGG